MSPGGPLRWMATGRDQTRSQNPAYRPTHRHRRSEALLPGGSLYYPYILGTWQLERGLDVRRVRAASRRQGRGCGGSASTSVRTRSRGDPARSSEPCGVPKAPRRPSAAGSSARSPRESTAVPRAPLPSSSTLGSSISIVSGAVHNRGHLPDGDQRASDPGTRHDGTQEAQRLRPGWVLLIEDPGGR